MKKTMPCVECGAPGSDLYSYSICDDCKSRLGLFTDATIKKHIALYDASKDHSYADEIGDRLALLERDYIKKRIKLLHIQDRLKTIR